MPTPAATVAAILSTTVAVSKQGATTTAATTTNNTEIPKTLTFSSISVQNSSAWPDENDNLYLEKMTRRVEHISNLHGSSRLGQSDRFMVRKKSYFAILRFF